MSDNITINYEFNNCIDIITELQKIATQAKNSNADNETIEYVKLKNAYMLNAQYQFSMEKTEDASGDILIGGIIATKNPFQCIQVKFAASKELVEKFTPMYKTFYYSDQADTKISETYFPKADLILKLITRPKTDTEKASADVYIEEIYPIDTDKEIGQIELNKTETTESLRNKAIDILRKKPFLIGFAGVKNIIIPIVFNNDSDYNKFPEIHNFSIPNTTSLNQLLVKVDVFSGFKKGVIKVPVFLGEPKIMMLMGTMNQDVINIFRSKFIILDNYQYVNTATFIPIFITNIEKIFDITNTQASSDLKTSTFINDIIANSNIDDIKTLIKVKPFTVEELEKEGIMMNDTMIFLVLTGLLIKENYYFDNDTLWAIKNLFNTKTLLAEANKLITETDLENILSIYVFMKAMLKDHPEYKDVGMEDIVNDIVEKTITITLSDFKTKFIDFYRISEKRFETIKKDVFETSGLFEVTEETEGNDIEKIRMTKNVKDYIKQKKSDIK
jgi:hypothetical protein